MSSDIHMKVLFTQMRVQILHMKASTPNLIDNAYAYAWENSIYPTFHDYDESVPDMAHENFGEQFLVSKAFVDEVIRALDEDHGKGRSPTFYELETKFGGKGDRMSLIKICRYSYLFGAFSNDLWESLLKPTEHPAEAGNFRKEYKISDISL